jgi:hypothetical protein
MTFRGERRQALDEEEARPRRGAGRGGGARVAARRARIRRQSGAAGFQQLVDALRAGVTYVNVHSMNFRGGEIRARINDDNQRQVD